MTIEDYVKEVKEGLKKLSDSMNSLSANYANINGKLRGIQNHLKQLNGKVSIHEEEIDSLKLFRARYEALKEERKRQRAFDKERTQIRLAIVTLIVVSIVNIIIAVYKTYVG